MFVTDCAVSAVTFTPETARDDMAIKSNASGVHQLRAMAGLCNAAEFNAASMQLPLHERGMYGDATDQAILKFSEGLGPVSELRDLWRRNFELAFNSKNKFMIRTFSLAEPAGLDIALSVDEASQWKPNDLYVLLTFSTNSED